MLNCESLDRPNNSGLVREELSPRGAKRPTSLKLAADVGLFKTGTGNDDKTGNTSDDGVDVVKADEIIALPTRYCRHKIYSEASGVPVIKITEYDDAETTSCNHDHVVPVVPESTDLSDRWRDMEMALKWIYQEIRCMKQQDRALVRHFLGLRAVVHQLRGVDTSLSFNPDGTDSPPPGRSGLCWSASLQPWTASTVTDSPVSHREMMNAFERQMLTRVYSPGGGLSVSCADIKEHFHHSVDGVIEFGDEDCSSVESLEDASWCSMRSLEGAKLHSDLKTLTNSPPLANETEEFFV